MAKNLNQPEAPREGLEETRRDLDELRSEVANGPIEVGFWPIISSSAATLILDSLKLPEETDIVDKENPELDKDVKNWMEKIINKSFENIISEYKKYFPMWFENLSIKEKINAISLKIALNKLWNNASKYPINKIKEEALEQKKWIINKASERLSNLVKSKNDLKSSWLTDNECNKLIKFLEDAKIIKVQKSNNWWEAFYGKNWVIIWEEEENREYNWRMAVAQTESYWPIIMPLWPSVIIRKLLENMWIIENENKQQKHDQSDNSKKDENKENTWEAKPEEWKHDSKTKK